MNIKEVWRRVMMLAGMSRVWGRWFRGSGVWRNEYSTRWKRWAGACDCDGIYFCLRG